MTVRADPPGADCRLTPVADPAALAAHLSARLPDFGRVQWVPEIGSTNATLLTRARSEGTHDLPWLLGTHLQTEGRGRAGRAWQNQPGSCLMMSLALGVDMPGHRLPALSPLSGLAAAEALRALAGRAAPDIKVKWPNDVLFAGKKLGGILVETTRAREGRGHVLIIGMGLNITQGAHLSAELARGIADWTEVLDAAGGAAAHDVPHDAAHHAERALPSPGDVQALARVAATLAQAWRDVVAQCGEQGFAGLRERYEAVDALLGQEVNVLEQGDILFHGTACGYDDDGRMLVQTSNEGIKPVSVGDVSVRPREARA